MAPARLFAETGAPPLARRERRPLNQAAYATRADGSLVNLTVVDLSNEGCGIMCATALSVGERLEIAVADRGKIGATVRWVDGARSGLSFDTVAEPAVEQTNRLHERVSVMLGSRNEVQRVTDYHREASEGAASPAQAA